jgi:hypothetical protein
MAGMEAQYQDLIRRLRRLGIKAELHAPDQLCLPSRIWVSWKNSAWYASTWVPTCYRIPEAQDVLAVCQSCFNYAERNPWYHIPAPIVEQYDLELLSVAAFETLFPQNEDESP